MTTRTPGDALALLELTDCAQARVQHRLHRGRTGDCWLIEQGGQRYVLRIDAPRAARYGHDRVAELRINQVVADAGIAPDVIAAAPQHGVMLTRYLDGRAWTEADLSEPANLRRLAATLRRLHALRPAVRRFDLVTMAQRYASAIGDSQAATAARNIKRLLQRTETADAVLCHNDLVAGNVIDAQRLWLIDWEYAGLGNRYFDLAVVAQHHRLPGRLRNELLRAYAGRADSAAAAQLELWCEIYAHLLALWQRLPSA